MAGQFTGSYKRAFNVAGLSFGINSSVDSSLAIPWDESVAAAKIGQLTTRTSDTVGTLTMNASHGIITADRLDIYWTISGGGRRYGVTVGTVSVNSVPFSGGAGDNLPVNLTAITAMVPTSLPIVITGNDVVSIATNCPVGGTVVFADASNVTLHPVLATSSIPTYVWTSVDGGTNPLAGDALAKVFLSHGSSAAASVLTGCVQYDP